MTRINAFVARHHMGFISAAVTILGLGFALFFGSLILMTVRKGRWMSGEALNEYYRGISQPALGVHVKFAGQAPVFAARDDFSLADLKQAWRSGELWRPEARKHLARAAGAILLFVGFCLVQLIVLPPAAKGYAPVLLAAGAIWTAFRLARA